MIDLAYVLRSAWRISWRHKRLWLLGFVASLGLAGTRLGVTSRGVWEQAARELPPDLGQAVLRFLDSPYFTVVVVGFGLIALLISVGLAMLSSVGRAALVAQVQVAEERGAVSVRAGWKVGRQHLWPVFLLRLVLGIPTLLATVAGATLVVLWTVPALMGSYWPGGNLAAQASAQLVALVCLVPTMGLLLLVSIPLNVLLRLAVRACTLEGLGVRESVRRAADSARKHRGATVLLWLVQLGVTVGAVVLLGLPLVFGVAALSFGALAVGVISLLWSIGLTALVGLVGWLGAAAVAGVVEVFVSALWTLAYREMHGLGLTGEAGAAVEQTALA